VTKDLFLRKSGEGTNLDTKKTKTEKESKKRGRKVTCLMGTVVVTVPTFKQMTIGFSARSEKYDSTKNVTMIGL
jgi:hypothetical protein